MDRQKNGLSSIADLVSTEIFTTARVTCFSSGASDGADALPTATGSAALAMPWLQASIHATLQAFILSLERPKIMRFPIDLKFVSIASI